MKNDPAVFSDGARYERKTILAKVRREMSCPKSSTFDVLADLEEWIIERRNRYESKPGGLGKKKK